MLETVLAQGAEAFGIAIDAAAFRAYYELLTAANETVNLTAIGGEDGVAALHFLDSLALLTLPPIMDAPPGACVLDVGSGAGFPGLPLAVARRDLCFTLLDAREKRIAFLETAVLTLRLTNVECIHARAEEYAARHREQFDIAISRAVAGLRELAELSLPMVAVGGFFAAMKSRGTDDEVAQSAGAFASLGGGVPVVTDYALPDGTPRRLVTVRKLTETDARFPRRYKKISTDPL